MAFFEALEVERNITKTRRNFFSLLGKLRGEVRLWLIIKATKKRHILRYTDVENSIILRRRTKLAFKIVTNSDLRECSTLMIP